MRDPKEILMGFVYTPTCFCGRPVTCIGEYEPGSGVRGACDTCCGHGNEDGWCRPIPDVLYECISDLRARLATAERELAEARSRSADLTALGTELAEATTRLGAQLRKVEEERDEYKKCIDLLLYTDAKDEVKNAYKGALLRLKGCERELAEAQNEIESLHETIGTWKEATGLLVGGGIDHVEPEDLKRELAEAREWMREAVPWLTELVGIREWGRDGMLVSRREKANQEIERLRALIARVEKRRE